MCINTFEFKTWLTDIEIAIR